jgi:hypothetical protein
MKRGTWLLLALVLMVVAQSCAATGQLPNGCKYKLVAPKFKA